MDNDDAFRVVAALGKHVAAGRGLGYHARGDDNYTQVESRRLQLHPSSITRFDDS